MAGAAASTRPEVEAISIGVEQRKETQERNECLLVLVVTPAVGKVLRTIVKNKKFPPSTHRA